LRKPATDVALGQNQSVVFGWLGKSLSFSLRKLEKRGFIERTRGTKDLRNFTLRLTDDGKRELALLEPYARAHEAGLREAVGPEVMPIFLDTLTRISAALEGDAGRAERFLAIDAAPDAEGQELVKAVNIR
jgi:DNA-binding PadR family transcriptional regulator